MQETTTQVFTSSDTANRPAPVQPSPPQADPAEAIQRIVDVMHVVDDPDTQWDPKKIDHVARVLIQTGLVPADVNQAPEPSKRVPTVLELTEREPHAHQAAPVLQMILEHVYPNLRRGDITPAIDCPTWLFDLLAAAQLTYQHWPDIGTDAIE
jgi:hypothetical protein